MPKQIQRIVDLNEKRRRLAQCPFCEQWLQFQFVGSHWRLACLTRNCEGYCYIYEWGGFDAVKWIAYAEARNRVLWEEVKTNTNYIFHIENYLDIEQRYVKKRYVKKEKGE